MTFSRFAAVAVATALCVAASPAPSSKQSPDATGPHAKPTPRAAPATAVGDGHTHPTPAQTSRQLPNPTDLVTYAEDIRCPAFDHTVDVIVTDRKGAPPATKEETRSYQTLLKGRDKALVKFVLPASDNRTRVLLSGTDMWVHLPTTAKPMRVSARQKVVGNAAYGDVTRLTFAGNYTALLNRRDVFANEPVWVVDLNAITGRAVTYDRVEYWISQRDGRPLRALYQTLGGKIIREGLFEDYGDVFGQKRPRQFTLIDRLKTDHVTIMRFENYKKSRFPALLFEKQNLGRE